MHIRQYQDTLEADLVKGELRRGVDQMAYTEGRVLYTAALLPSINLAEMRACVRPGRAA